MRAAKHDAIGPVNPVLKKSWSSYFKKPFEDLQGTLIDKLKELGEQPFLVSKYDSEYNDEYDNYLYMYFFNNGALVMRNGRDDEAHHLVTVVTTEQRIYDAVQQIVEPQQEKLPPPGTIHMMCSTSDGPEFVSVGVGGHPLERDNYTEHELKLYDRIKDDLVAPNPKGRLHIMAGAPGSGKTYAIRGLLSETRNVAFVVVPVTDVASLANPSSLTALTDLREDQGNKPIVLIIEDADQCLVNRKDGDLGAISAILNMGDGLMGAVLDIRIVATTNAKLENLDRAITRPGRLSTEITFEALPIDKANAIYKRLTGKEGTFEKPTILAEIYTKAHDAGWEPPQIKVKKPMGFRGFDP